MSGRGRVRRSASRTRARRPGGDRRRRAGGRARAMSRRARSEWRAHCRAAARPGGCTRAALSSTASHSDESLAMHRALDALGGFVKRTAIAGNGESLRAVPQFYRHRNFLALDPATRKHLELTRAQGQNPRATLLATLDRCATSMGSRMLGALDPQHRWSIATTIVGRQDAVQRYSTSTRVAKRSASCSPDASIWNASHRRCASGARLPRDLASLRRTLDVLRPLRASRAPGARRDRRERSATSARPA